MANPSALRFDHREVAVIFSLFIFVSLLMFTVGIVVGKGLAQAKYEHLLIARTAPAAVTPAQEGRVPLSQPPTSLNYPAQSAPPARSLAQQPASAPAPETKPSESAPAARTPLKLIPSDEAPDTLDPTTAKEAQALTKNPRIRALLDDPVIKKTKAPEAATSAPQERGTAAVAPAAALPPSFAEGPFTVQVGSYPTKTDANDRVSQLKAMGFPHAYASIKKFGDGKEIWYRVWLGYYPDMETAKTSGEYLQQRGEVNNYLIRKSDNPG